MWHPIGYVIAAPTDREITVGRFASDLPGSVLSLQAAYRGPGSPDVLSFCILDFLDDDQTRSLGSERWWPKPQPSIVRLGPGVASAVSGSVLLRMRRYNRSWLESGLPGPTLPVLVSAWLPVGTTVPRFVPRGFTVGDRFFDLTGGPVGPGAAHPLGPIGG